jgi:phage gpG-like protein
MITVAIHGSNSVIAAHIAKTPLALDAAAQTGLSRGLQSAVATSGTKYLTGPRPLRLGVKTGRLRGSLTFEILAGTDGSVTGRIGSNVKYAAFHEFGFHGVENVKAFTRVTGQFNAKGEPVDTRKPIIERGGNVLGFNKTRKQSAGAQKSGFVTFGHVRAHQRRVNYAGRPFLKPALLESIPIIEREINAAITKIKPDSGPTPS